MVIQRSLYLSGLCYDRMHTNQLWKSTWMYFIDSNVNVSGFSASESSFAWITFTWHVNNNVGNNSFEDFHAEADTTLEIVFYYIGQRRAIRWTCFYEQCLRTFLLCLQVSNSYVKCYFLFKTYSAQCKWVHPRKKPHFSTQYLNENKANF